MLFCEKFKIDTNKKNPNKIIIIHIYLFNLFTKKQVKTYNKIMIQIELQASTQNTLKISHIKRSPRNHINIFLTFHQKKEYPKKDKNKIIIKNMNTLITILAVIGIILVFISFVMSDSIGFLVTAIGSALQIPNAVRLAIEGLEKNDPVLTAVGIILTIMLLFCVLGGLLVHYIENDN